MGRRTKKAANSRTHTLVIQDRSGSMASRSPATISGYNEFIEGLQANAEGEVLVTLIQFDTEVNTVYAEKPLPEVPKLDSKTYTIGGATALRDAVGKGINIVEKRVRKGDRVNVTIMTDGQENSSREYTHEQILAHMDAKRKANWEFNFLGAGKESWATGQSLGIGNDNSIYYGGDAHSHQVAFAAAAASNVATTRGLSGSYTASAPLAKSSLEDTSGANETRNSGSGWVPDGSWIPGSGEKIDLSQFPKGKDKS